MSEVREALGTGQCRKPRREVQQSTDGREVRAVLEGREVPDGRDVREGREVRDGVYPLKAGQGSGCLKSEAFLGYLTLMVCSLRCGRVSVLPGIRF
jgi:hypothetical protein